jgi:dihydrofolate synthase/folylpolyglutamate synthase
MDHMDYLGNSLTEIAREKCGILKTGVPVAAMAEDENVCELIRQEAAKKDCFVSFVRKDMVQPVHADIETGQCFHFDGMENLHIRNAASYQLLNAALAVKALKLLGDLQPDEVSIRSGLAAMYWPARFETVSQSPLILYDGAHNPAAARRLKDSVISLMPERPVILILGVLADKDYRSMLRIFASLNARLITFAPDSPRALPAEALAEAARGLFSHIFPAKSLHQAWEMYDLWRQEMPAETAMIQCGTLSAYAAFCREYKSFQMKNGE